MTRLIYADALKNDGHLYIRSIDLKDYYEIDHAPTVDAVEVVRCKNCVHYGGVTFGFMCRKFSGIDTKICMPADGYCSYGERKVSE